MCADVAKEFAGYTNRVHVYQTTRRHIPQDGTIQGQLRLVLAAAALRTERASRFTTGTYSLRLALCLVANKTHMALLFYLEHTSLFSQLDCTQHDVTRCACAFANPRKLTTTFVMSNRMEQLTSQWTDFHEIWYLSILRKSVDKIQLSLQSEKYKGHFT